MGLVSILLRRCDDPVSAHGHRGTQSDISGLRCKAIALDVVCWRDCAHTASRVESASDGQTQRIVYKYRQQCAQQVEPEWSNDGIASCIPALVYLRHVRNFLALSGRERSESRMSPWMTRATRDHADPRPPRRSTARQTREDVPSGCVATHARRRARDARDSEACRCTAVATSDARLHGRPLLPQGHGEAHARVATHREVHTSLISICPPLPVRRARALPGT